MICYFFMDYRGFTIPLRVINCFMTRPNATEQIDGHVTNVLNMRYLKNTLSTNFINFAVVINERHYFEEIQNVFPDCGRNRLFMKTFTKLYWHTLQLEFQTENSRAILKSIYTFRTNHHKSVLLYLSLKSMELFFFSDHQPSLFRILGT